MGDIFFFWKGGGGGIYGGCWRVNHPIMSRGRVTYVFSSNVKAINMKIFPNHEVIYT